MNSPGYSPLAPLFRVCDGVRVRFADNKADSSVVTVLMLSPWPESLWAYRRIWDRVSAVARVVAIDLPGFGHSDGRPELIAPDAMGTFLARLIDEWSLGAPHVVGPDVGTAAALFLAANAPERITSLTVGGGAVRVPIDAGGALKDVIEAPSLDVVRQLDARANIGFAVEPVAGADSEPEVHEDYVSAYDLGRFAESASLRPPLPPAEPGAARSVADDHHAGADHRGTRRRPGAVVQQRVPRRPAAQHRDPPTGCRPLRVGAGIRGLWPSHRRLGHRRVPAPRRPASLNLRCSSNNCALASSALAPTQVSRAPGPRTCCSPAGGWRGSAGNAEPTRRAGSIASSGVRRSRRSSVMAVRGRCR